MAREGKQRKRRKQDTIVLTSQPAAGDLGPKKRSKRCSSSYVSVVPSGHVYDPPRKWQEIRTEVHEKEKHCQEKPEQTM